MLMYFFVAFALGLDEEEELYKMINQYRRQNGLYLFQRSFELDKTAKERLKFVQENNMDLSKMKSAVNDIKTAVKNNGYNDMIKICENLSLMHSFEHESFTNVFTELKSKSTLMDPMLKDYIDVGIAMIVDKYNQRKYWDVIMARKENQKDPDSKLITEDSI
ncbi:hypothetical protein EDEG_01232 [Edhazardia aedis USNM 41457]|uniref:Uncharacterized protein n=1 Tax=Edhazardia aedis (strain USNM 41457) TaxID=1003232 RepID=J9DAP9_EDHAE|nr:hypothetical protein EDEG_01232 [Edhazardia aedis USNM 41457]|eukprot:EJW04549.1 hypothetical protein EDEG_01232 [Edhazardia aedis USNM 41457]